MRFFLRMALEEAGVSVPKKHWGKKRSRGTMKRKHGQEGGGDAGGEGVEGAAAEEASTRAAAFQKKAKVGPGGGGGVSAKGKVMGKRRRRPRECSANSCLGVEV